MSTFKVTLAVSAKLLPSLLEVVTPQANLLGVELVKDGTPAEPKEPIKRIHYKDGKRLKGISGKDLAIQILRTEPRLFSYKEMAEEFVRHGFAANSTSPVLSNLINHEKKVRFHGNGMYSLPHIQAPKK